MAVEQFYSKVQSHLCGVKIIALKWLNRKEDKYVIRK